MSKKIQNDSKYLINKKTELNDLQKKLKLYDILKNTNLKKDVLIDNLNLFFDRRTLSRILNFNELFNKQTDLSGNIALFGVYYGRDLINLLHFYFSSNKHHYLFFLTQQKPNFQLIFLHL